MANIDNQPVRLTPVAPPRRRAVPVMDKIHLEQPENLSRSFADVLVARRSAEKFGEITLNDLSTWLYYLASIQAVQVSDRNRQRRFVGSFGALHPAHILLGMPDHNWFGYLPGEHSVGRLRVNVEVA